MEPKNNKRLHRRKFLGLAGVAATAGLTGTTTWANTAQALEVANKMVLPAPLNESAVGNTAATIFETKVICRQSGRHLGDGSEYGVNKAMHPVILKRVMERDRYMGWPTLAKTTDGELIVAFSGDRDSHVCPWGKTQIIRSMDNGKTWSKPETVNNTPLDDRDAGIIETKNGTLILSWFTSIAFTLPMYKTALERYARYAEKVTPEIIDHWLGNWVRRSTDGGKTWDPPVRTINSGPHGPISLRDGRLLYIGTGTHKERPGICVEQSSDDGKTWHVIAALPEAEDPTSRLSEPHMVELASGKLLAMIRNEPKDRSKCFLLQSESNDGGKTRSALRNTGIWGYPPHLVQLKNGWVLVVYGYRLDPLSERACISRDEGRTWDTDNQITLAASISPDLGYPSSVQLNDGSILTAFYQPEKADGPTVVMSTHWKLNDD